MNADRLKSLQIEPAQKQRRQRPWWVIFLGALLLTAVATFFAWPRAEDTRRVKHTGVKPPTNTAALPATSQAAAVTNATAGTANDVVLTVSGYIVNRERIEISPRFLGLVKWIGVKKGDSVTNGQVVVLLDDAEYKARLQEAEGRLASMKAAVAKAELDYERMSRLAREDTESRKSLDDARLQLEAARADLKQAEGAYALVKTYLDWTVIRSPINGVVLEKLVNPDELVMPQSFGGPRGPSTALLAVADPKDLQVEIDLNEADLSKISLHQKCRVSPEAYPEKVYPG
ncbi:MAG TPA: efflux RND transporter periplasmic adaptor subunit, partial [Candidatus Sulfotelmatobacter sp.]|nr:efflux RND transporter periplasmic adaptor subunit [Candidatus Sulfotelmatobacter sp.]